ncbi:MAG: GNAT family N-acetyltransferase [Bacteroidetes bacterium]|nr:GNAT family N-acetyltransferase [Bacteroidota bacterium]
MKIKVDNEITLKDLELDSAEILFDLIDSCRDYLSEWLSWVEETLQLNDTILYIQSVAGHDMFNGRSVFEIWYKNDLAGLIDFHSGDKVNMSVEIGYWLGEKFQNKGIMTRACSACIDYAFTTLGFNRIVIKCALGNVKSQAIPKRLNFKFEGIEREGQILNYRFNDLMVFSMLKKEWPQSGSLNVPAIKIYLPGISGV